MQNAYAGINSILK